MTFVQNREISGFAWKGLRAFKKTKNMAEKALFEFGS
jgi:hypothetical protein